LYAFLISPVRVICPVHLTVLGLITLINICEEYDLRRSLLCSCFCLLSLLSGPRYFPYFIFTHPVAVLQRATSNFSLSSTLRSFLVRRYGYCS
jgi:hypothetical protein